MRGRSCGLYSVLEIVMYSNYQETIDWLFNQIPMFQNIGAGAYKPGLETVTRLSEAFGNPHRNFKTIHVGGTNGKGSTSSLIASVLMESGHKVGLYTSPHLVDFRERIRVDGEVITEQGVIDFINRYKSMRLGLEPSFFELATVMAFDWFAGQGCDMAVIEVGLGGRLDSTNIIMPELSVITNISLDHTSLLGSTETAIAREKAGIIKDGIPVVVGRAEGEVMEVFSGVAAGHHSELRLADRNAAYGRLEKDGTYYIYKDTAWGDIRCPLTGDCQPENANTVLNALSFLPDIRREAVVRGFGRVIENTGLMGRWTVMRTCPTVVCDTGHNSGGWAYLGPRLAEIAASGDLHIVIGFVNDKDISSILGMMPRGAAYYFACPGVRRGRPAGELKALAAEVGLTGEAYSSVAEAYDAAMRKASSVSTVFVGGSTFVVADYLAAKFSD